MQRLAAGAAQIHHFASGHHLCHSGNESGRLFAREHGGWSRSVAWHGGERGIRLEAAAIGVGFLVVAVLAVPALGYFTNRSWLGLELFGSAPDPTCLATFGVILMMRYRFRALLMVIPAAWSVCSALTLRAMDDPLWPLLPVAAAVAIGAAVAQVRGEES